MKKIIYVVCSMAIIIFIYYSIRWNNLSYVNLVTYRELMLTPTTVLRSNGSIYILQWTKPDTLPFVYMGTAQQTFIDNKCFYNNCYVTSNRTYLNSLQNFDVILFHGPELYREDWILPAERSAQQKYVFVSMESSDYYPMCSNKYDDYFNWTWTYRLNSDIYYGYMIIRNKLGEVIGPKEVMQWINVDDMEPIGEEIKAKLTTKNIAAAWFVSNCDAPSGRQKVARELQAELTKYNMTLDIYGGCGTKSCSASDMVDCLWMVERDYYFYLAFENSFNEDYVTEKLLHALKHYAIPIVYGAANYTRFMPDGIYLNARELDVRQLASKMFELMNNENEYYKFFKWRNHYSYHDAEEAPETNYYCAFCAKLNSDKISNKTSIYNDFREWWNPKKLRANVCRKFG